MTRASGASDRSNDSRSYEADEDKTLTERIDARVSIDNENRRQTDLSITKKPKHDGRNEKSFASFEMCILKELIPDNQRRTQAMLKEKNTKGIHQQIPLCRRSMIWNVSSL